MKKPYLCKKRDFLRLKPLPVRGGGEPKALPPKQTGILEGTLAWVWAASGVAFGGFGLTPSAQC